MAWTTSAKPLLTLTPKSSRPSVPRPLPQLIWHIIMEQLWPPQHQQTKLNRCCPQKQINLRLMTKVVTPPPQWLLSCITRRKNCRESTRRQSNSWSRGWTGRTSGRNSWSTGSRPCKRRKTSITRIYCWRRMSAFCKRASFRSRVSSWSRTRRSSRWRLRRTRRYLMSSLGRIRSLIRAIRLLIRRNRTLINMSRLLNRFRELICKRLILLAFWTKLKWYCRMRVRFTKTSRMTAVIVIRSGSPNSTNTVRNSWSNSSLRGRKHFRELKIWRKYWEIWNKLQKRCNHRKFYRWTWTSARFSAILNLLSMFKTMIKRIIA